MQLSEAEFLFPVAAAGSQLGLGPFTEQAFGSVFEVDKEALFSH